MQSTFQSYKWFRHFWGGGGSGKLVNDYVNLMLKYFFPFPGTVDLVFVNIHPF